MSDIAVNSAYHSHSKIQFMSHSLVSCAGYGMHLWVKSDLYFTYEIIIP